MGLSEENNMCVINGFKCINLLYPGFVKHPILIRNVQLTKDGRYILNYYDKKKNVLYPDYTEIINVKGTWFKYPFKKKYDLYEFESFDKDISDTIVDQLPLDMEYRVFVKKDNKKSNSFRNNAAYEQILKMTGSTIAFNRNIKYVYLTLLALENDKYIVKNGGQMPYNFDFPFPAFSIPEEIYHEAYNTSIETDENYNLNYNQHEYTREKLPKSVRVAISEFLNEQKDNVIDITRLPVLEVEDQETGDRMDICFISCPDVNLFKSIIDSEFIAVDCDVLVPSSYDNDLESAFHYEKPMIIGFKDGSIKTNGIKHSIIQSSNKNK